MLLLQKLFSVVSEVSMQIQRIGAQYTPQNNNLSKSHAQNFKGDTQAEIFKLTFEETLRILNGNFNKAVKVTSVNLRKIFKPESCELKPHNIPNQMNHFFRFKTTPESKPITIMYNTTKKHSYIEFFDPNIKDGQNSHIIFNNPYNIIA